MDIIFDAASTDQHFEQILDLQKRNLSRSISEDEQRQQGFVFAEHTTSELRIMASYLPQVIALNNDKVVGYNLGLHRSLKNLIPMLVPMFTEFERSEYKGRPLSTYKFMVGGQVCVDKEFRGKGLLSKLYHETRKRVIPDYELCVTEIAIRNVPSLKAHEKMGFEVVGTYSDEREVWNIVVWNLQL
jgi:hypothetical protein